MIKLSKDLTLPLDVAGEAIAILATRGAGKSYTSSVLIEELYLSRVQVVVIDPTGVYWGLRSNAKGTGDGVPIIVLGGVHGDVPLQETAGKLIADLVVDTAQSLVLDLSDFESDGAQCRFMTDFAERLYRRKARSRTTLHLVVDEADEFAPQRPQKNEARMLGAMAKFVRRGRSRGIGMTLITQRSASINKNLLDLVETMIVMRMLGPRDREAVNGWIKHKNLDDEHDVLSSLPSLPTGTAWVWSPMRDILQKVAMRRIETFDSYVTPKPGEVRVEPKALAKVDIDKLGEQIKATAEKAKADDPVALRKRIAELEKETSAPAGHSKIELNAEYARGYKIGFEDGYENAASDASKSYIKATGLLEDAVNTLRGFEPKKGPLTKNWAAPGVVRTEHIAMKPTMRPMGDGQSTIKDKAQRKFMTVLVQQNRALSRNQIAIFAGYSSKSSHVDNVLSQLRTQDYIEGNGSSIQYTKAGLEALGEYRALPIGEALREYWYHELDKGAASMLRVLCDAYPEPMTRDQVAEIAGYSKESSHVDNSLSQLRTRELIVGRAGDIKASENLF